MQGAGSAARGSNVSNRIRSFGGCLKQLMTTFEQTGINTNLLKGITALGFEQPTPVQARVIPLLLEGKSDVVALAQTGTGKTAAFGLPLIQLVDSGERSVQALVLCPTRELCRQVTSDLQIFSRHVKGIKTAAVYGGAAIDQQIREIRRGAQIVVATPGRLNDLINRGRVDLSTVRRVVFDEADEMLQMGFQDELNAILAQTPSEKRTLLFSATMSREIHRIACRYMKDPVEVTIGQRNSGVENVRHEMYVVRARDRYNALRRIVDHAPDIYAIIFCRTRRETADIAESLIRDGYSAAALHGELSQAQRDAVMKSFRNRRIQILVATDVAARGLDVNDVTHVINYNLPDDISAYTHRSGRTGRAGRTGTSVALVHMKERYRVRQIEKKINRKFVQCRIPEGSEICRKQLLKRAEKIVNVQMDYSQIDDIFDELAEKFVDMDREELIRRLMAMESGSLLEYYSNAPDLNPKAHGKRDSARKQPRVRRSEKTAEREYVHQGTEKSQGRTGRRGPVFTRFHLNVGRRQGVMPQALIGKINDIAGGLRIRVGKIEIMRNTAVMEAESRFTPQIMDAFQHASINGRSVSIEVARPAYASAAPGVMRKHRKSRKSNGRGSGKSYS